MDVRPAFKAGRETSACCSKTTGQNLHFFQLVSREAIPIPGLNKMIIFSEITSQSHHPRYHISPLTAARSLTKIRISRKPQSQARSHHSPSSPHDLNGFRLSTTIDSPFPPPLVSSRIFLLTTPITISPPRIPQKRTNNHLKRTQLSKMQNKS